MTKAIAPFTPRSRFTMIVAVTSHGGHPQQGALSFRTSSKPEHRWQGSNSLQKTVADIKPDSLITVPPTPSNAFFRLGVTAERQEALAECRFKSLELSSFVV
ncbi:hypothetical protein PoB_007342600 [Plakobranchus ocellatus]|uniref:Uncharacterized protein n=1 Tax=Plakobranchus ocellatus TaxID=259542 RepID=A0AAV4DSX2_9GAST|nr:hypothetical protein PoB_007342600 [Plakobranchus ocellatus]